MTQSVLITAVRLQQLAPHCNAEQLAPALDAAVNAHAIVTPLRLAHFLAQGAFESEGFTRFEEDLNYSIPELRSTWPSRFPTDESAAPFAHKPQALADDVYGGRMGNARPDDGWTYRGRGIFDLTGLDQYTAIGSLADQPFATQPDLVATVAGAAASAGAFWAYRGLNLMADRDDIQSITKRINGGLIGLSDREAWLKRTKALWGVPSS